jgi:hypothetical protein
MIVNAVLQGNFLSGNVKNLILASHRQGITGRQKIRKKNQAARKNYWNISWTKQSVFGITGINLEGHLD